ncbi:MAG: xanthine dehydrogenase family protein molybdopterin-binding subunit [Deltaproteobacteria bacterium]|nr:xanthine dehydrogenase family protein molybdopterin-binding subunit [Deltaproteobacteria bacterium]
MFIGKDMPRIDSLDKVLGRPVFAGDMMMEGMLHAAILRSTRPHAIIRTIDSAAALKLAGVVKIITVRDVPGENLFGIIKKDQPYLADGRVYCVGQPILIVVAETERTARQAMSLITIAYDEITPVFAPSASPDTAPSIHGESGNLLCLRTLIKGDAERALADADVVVSNTYRTTWVDHAFLETEAGIGYVDGSGRIVIASSTQNIHYKRREVSRLLAIPEESVQMIQTTTGGGFGGKLDMTVEGYLALAVYHTRRPVLMRFSREESFLSNTKRHPLYIDYTTGVRRDGSITGVKVSIVGDTGAFVSYGEVVCLRAACHATGPYEVPHAYVESRMFYTNNPVSGAMRGFGIPQLAFAHESQLDQIAMRLGMDRLDIRVKNALRKGSYTATSQLLEHSVGLVETLRKVEPYWRARKKESDRRGFGLGCMYYGCGNTGSSNPSGCHIRLAGDGRIALHLGACEIGQGSDTVLMQIMMETLGVGGNAVQLVRGDTDTSRDAGSSSASRHTYITGRAVYEASARTRSYLEESGYYRGRDLRDICEEANARGTAVFEGFFDPPTTPVDPATCQGVPYATYAFATHMTEVDVDRVTGECRIVKVHAAHDVGKVVNPTLVKGQVYGGVAMGIGFALMEAFEPGKTESFDGYYIPTSLDMPDIEVHLVEDEEPTGPFGAKGVGEPALIPQAAAIVNAITDATGARPFELPVDMERLKKLIG